MTNLEHAENAWQQLLASPNLNSNAKQQIEKQKSELIQAFSRSSFVATTLSNNPMAATRIIGVPPRTQETKHYEKALTEKLQPVNSEEELSRALRHFRNQEMACIAFNDVLNKQTITQSLKQVSALADVLITKTYHWLYDLLARRYGKPQNEHGDMHMYILGMGKLGGQELNFSSDIDLIFCYPEKGVTTGARKSLEHQQFFTKVAQKLIQALNKITNDGQVYRVDMRLRPFGDSGPLVTHFAALEDYYQDQGRHWERFAMIKARILNTCNPHSDDATSVAWLTSILQPFTYRRYLDFTTLDALRNMKKLIATEIRRRRLNNNIKLGAGGIREVEFFAQSFQLIHGGREPSLQSKSLLTALKNLSDSEIIEKETTETLAKDYLFLRKVEHTLQQNNDEQTQSLPNEMWRKQALAEVMGHRHYNEFYDALTSTMARIHSHFNELIEDPNEAHSQKDTLFAACQDAWQLSLDEQELSDAFSEYLSVDEIAGIFSHVVSFKAKQRNYRIGQKGEDTLNKLLPEILYVLVQQHPNYVVQVLSRLLGVIDAITGRTTYLDLLLENPDVLKQLVRLCERSDWVAQEIKRFPLLLDELLTPLYLGQQNTDIVTSKKEYEQELRENMLRIEQDDVEMLMDAWRQFKLCQQLRIAASDISDSLPINNVSDKLTVLAEVILENVVNAAWMQISERFGVPQHLEGEEKGFAVVGYGKLGGFELGYGSDLDLVFLHNAPRTSKTNGEKSIEAQQFYIKLAQRIMHLLNTKTLFGQLYETDLRLRPSGNAGLLCCHIEGFETYQHNEAWTWEHQALVRARGICGDKALLKQFSEVRAQILCLPRDIRALTDDVSNMRKKMRDHLLSNKVDKVDLKQCVGGITDIEFMAQFWVLAYSNKFRALTVYPDNLRIFEAAQKSNLLNEATVATLQTAYLALRRHYHHLTLADTKYADESDELDAIRQKVKDQWTSLFEV